MIADIFFSILLAFTFLMLGWQLYSTGYDNGERAARKAAEANKKENTPGN